MALLLAIGGYLWAGAAPPSLSAEPAGSIRGRVVDRTAAPRLLVAQPVRLEIVERGSTSERRAVTDAHGAFVFGGLPLGGVPRVFLVGTQYRGVPYEARVELTDGAPAQAVDLAVYEATRDQAAVRGTLAFAVMEASRGAVRVSVIQRLENATRRTVVTADGDPLVFPLPDGAEAVEFIGGWRHPRVERGTIADTPAVPPGVLQVGYAYGLEPRTPRLTLTWALPYGATDVEMLVGDPSLRVGGDGVRSAGVLSESGRRFARWSAGPVPRGGRIVFTFDGIAPRDDRWPAIAAAVLGGLLAGGLAFALRPRAAIR